MTTVDGRDMHPPARHARPPTVLTAPTRTRALLSEIKGREEEDRKRGLHGRTRAMTTAGAITRAAANTRGDSDDEGPCDEQGRSDDEDRER